MKLTKDSILALYGNTPTNFNAAYQNPLNPAVYPQNFSSFQGYSAVVPPATYPMAAPQQFVANPQQWVGAAPQYVPPHQFGATTTTTAAAYQYGAQSVVQNAGFVTPNPFAGIPASATVQQQFANLNLGTPAPPANAAPTVATNLWQ